MLFVLQTTKAVVEAWERGYRICLHRGVRYHAVIQAYNFGGETHLGAGHNIILLYTSTFVVPSAAIARVLTSTFVASTALTKGPQRFRLHGRDRSFTDIYMLKLTVLAKL